MTNRLRNPFRMRASEKIESDASFLRLYSPAVLESLAEKHEQGVLWGNVVYIHSTPGAGKSSLLRVFEPNCLNTLLNSKSSDDYKELYTTLKKLDAVNDHGVNVLGISLSCTRNYEILEDLHVSPSQKLRYFYSLLNVRIILATLRSIVSYRQLNFPDDLKRIQFSYNNTEGYFQSIKVPCNGQELFDWAAAIERKIYTAIDSFLPTADRELEGHSELFSILTLNSDTISVDGKKLPRRFLFMLDDTHKLTPTQRASLKRHVIERRSNCNIWISERLEALEISDNIRSSTERDYEELDIEQFWSTRTEKFEKILKTISTKRSAISSEDVNSFAENLENTLEEEVHKNEFIQVIREASIALKSVTEATSKYNQWVNYLENFDGTLLEKALLYKKVQILIGRLRGKLQMDFDFPLTVEELQDKLKSDLDAPAKLFLSKNENIPYYYGFSTVARISSCNIEQFLGFAADLFEAMLSNKISGKNIMLTPQAQQRILKKSADKRWAELSKLVPNSTAVRNFISELGKFSNKESFRENAPYGPGINGFSVKASGIPSLLQSEKETQWFDDPLYDPLANVISTCVSYNLLEPRNTKQGERGQEWTVFYLNRWLCVKYGLPLNFGGFRHKSPDELLKWTKS